MRRENGISKFRSDAVSKPRPARPASTQNLARLTPSHTIAPLFKLYSMRLASRFQQATQADNRTTTMAFDTDKKPDHDPRLTAETVHIDAGTARLTGTVLQPANSAPQLVIQINAATGIKASYYRAFAEWLAQTQNAAVMIWDYRDFGASGRPDSSPATMTDWAITDPGAVHTYLADRFPALPRWCIGHSLGGLAMAFQPDAHLYDRVISVAAGELHSSEYPWPYKAKVYALWYLLGPLGCLFRPYFPGKSLGLGNNLPKGVFWQWRKWLLTPGSCTADPELGGIQSPGISRPMTLIALEDDELIGPEYVARLARWHPNAPSTFRVLKPAELGMKHIGHLHAFSPRNKPVWPQIIA